MEKSGWTAIPSKPPSKASATRNTARGLSSMVPFCTTLTAPPFSVRKTRSPCVAIARGISRPVATIEMDDDWEDAAPDGDTAAGGGAGSGIGSDGEDNTITENATAPATAAIWIFMFIYDVCATPVNYLLTAGRGLEVPAFSVFLAALPAFAAVFLFLEVRAPPPSPLFILLSSTMPSLSSLRLS